MDLLEKIDTFLISEAKSGIDLSPLAKSEIGRYAKGWDKDSVKSLVDTINKRITDGMKYEISFVKKDQSEKTPLMIYRKDSDVIKRNITPENLKAYKKAVEEFLKGTGLKIVGEVKVADWLGFKVA